jgi:hypothetical protein
MNKLYEDLAATPPSERVLLLSYCLRPSETCPGKFFKTGIACPDDCTEDCVVGRLRKKALALGYKGVCIAAGGAMALRFVSEQHPLGIVAIACEKELAEGREGVQKMTKNGNAQPILATIPLVRDGCVDTEVDEELAMAAIVAGCPEGSERHSCREYQEHQA